MDTNLVMAGSHDHRLVALSVLISILAAYAVREFAERVGTARGRVWLTWLVGGALVGGIGMWSMMAAVVFTYSGDAPDLSHAVHLFSLGIPGISIVPALVIIVAALAALFDRLRKQRAQLDELFEQAPQAVALMNADSKVVRVSREFTRLFGFRPEEVVGRHLRELFIPDESQEDVQKYIDLLARGQRVEAEGIRQRKDGTRLYVSFVHVPVSLPGGQISTCVVYRDITGRKLVEESLKLFQGLVDQSSDAIVVVDPNTLNFLDCNKSAYQILGYSREEFLALNVSDVDPNIDPSRLSQVNEGIEKSGLATFESLHLRKDGSTFPVEVSVKVIRHEKDYHLAMVRDITERKRAEGALRQAEEKYHGIFENAVEGIFQTTPDGRFITANSALARMLGYDSPDELLGSRTDIARQQYVDPERRSEFKRQLEEHGVVWKFEHEAYRKNGRKIWLSENVRAVCDQSGAVLYYEGFSEDITERKRAEEALRQSEREYRGLFENAHDAIVIFSPEDEIVLEVNQRACEIYGFSHSEFIGMSLKTITKDIEHGVLRIKETLEQGTYYNFETVQYRSDGTEMFLEINASVVAYKGRLAIQSTNRDITERKRVGQRLREYEKAVEGLDEMIVVIDRDYRYLLANRAFLTYRGLEREQLVGRRIPEIPTTGVFENIIKEKVDQCFAGDVVKYEMKYDYLTMGERDLLVSYFPIEGPTGIERAACVLKDITESKRAEEALKESQRTLEEAQRIAHVGNWNWDLHNNVVTWSDELYRIFGVDAQTFNPANEGLITEYTHAEDRALMNRVVENFLKTKKPCSFHYRIMRPDGEVRVIYSRGEVVSDERGNPLRVFGTAQDVTERMQAEERLRATTEQLRALSARIHSAKEEEGTRIAREIHDELGGALTSLRWDLESIDKFIAEAGDQPRLHLLRERIGAMLRLTETTIGATRRITSELRPGILDDLGLVAAIEWQAGQFQARTGITCRCDCSLENLDLGREQSTAVFRIFQEALTNILRHAQATMVDITAKAEAGEFVLKIVDNGRGITEDERIGARSLGLLGMRERAHLIGGKININGVEGEETVITIQVTLSG